MKDKFCACGRKLYQRPNSTIQPKQCPNCLLKNLTSGDTEATNKGLSKKKHNSVSKNKKSAKSKAMELADKWFSRYIRLKYSFVQNGKAICICYTCGTPKAANNIDNGHWQRRGYKTTRFNENNARPQCKQCNYYRSGMPEIFEHKLIKELGTNEVEKLKYLAQQIGEDNQIFYKEQSDKFRELTNKIIKEKGIIKWW